MKAIRQKLKSEQGASILLALLFFLVCTMVCASILMAAMSNAGKKRSNIEEQQSYLVLSSALQTVCDDLVNATYHGQWTVTVQTEGIETGDGTEDESSYTKTTYTYTQVAGSYTGSLTDMLLDDFDSIFAKSFTEGNLQKVNGVDYEVKALSGLQDPVTHTLTVTPNTGISDLDDAPVTITMLVRSESSDGTKDYAIDLVASYKNYSMTAEVTTSVSGIPKPVTDSEIQNGATYQSQQAIQWKLGWIDHATTVTTS
jgi:hypothetical protein